VRLISKLPRKARWAVPAGAVAAVGLVIAGSALAGAQAAPQLPARTTAQLLAAVDAPSALPSAMQAVVQETVSLGLPALPGSGSSTSDPLSGLSLLSGTHTFRIWYDGPTRVRIAIPVTLGETDLRRDGRDVWLWESRTNKATHYVLPASSEGTPALEPPAQAAPTPQQLARQILAAVGQTTTVGLQPDVTVAGQAAYQLSLAPKDSRSLIGQVRIAIDAANSLPLRVEIFARGASSPALHVAYTSISFTRPDPSNFSFTAPPGARVKTVTVPAFGGFPPGGPLLGLPGSGSEIIGSSSGSQPVAVPAHFRCVHPPRIPAAAIKQIIAQLPKGMPRAARASLLKSLETGLPPCSVGHGALPAGWCGTAPSTSVTPGFIAAGAPTVMGKDWLSVLVLPAGGLPAAGPPGSIAVFSSSSPPDGSASPPSSAYSSTVTFSGSSSANGTAPSETAGASVTFSSGAVSGGPGVAVSGLGSALLSAARPVHGSWGSGRLLRTSLISVLITDGGQVLIGAVQPSVLYADAAQLG
jgi:outer membrane lipoprotein-sorting protein